MSKELIVATNPAAKRKRRTSAKQRAAARRNIKKAQAARRRKSGGTRRRNPSTTTSRRRRSSSGTSRRRRVGSYKRRSNPSRRGGFRMPSFQGIVNRQLIPALIGGAGGVANDIGYAFASRWLPMQLQTGPARHAAKALTAIVLGWLTGAVVSRRLGDQVGIGALTVVGYNVSRDVVARFAPDLNMGMLLEPGLGYPGAGWNPNTGSFAYGDRSNMGALLPPGSNANQGWGGVDVPRQLQPASMYSSPSRSFSSDLDMEY